MQPDCSTIHASSELTEIRSAVHKRGGTVQGVDDATLLRFLRARSMNPDKAAAMFVAHQEWRASFVPLGYIPDREVCTELAAGTIALQGNSKKGWPLLVCLTCNQYRKNFRKETFQRFVVHVLDKTVASAPPGVENLMAVVDLNNIGFQNLDTKAFIAGFQLLQDYYPERLSKLFIVNAPYIFLSIWNFLSSFLDKATTEKITFLDTGEMAKTLLSEVDAHVLPTIYGGEAQIRLIQNFPSPEGMGTALQKSVDG